jgi:hypothetical protein
MKKTIKFLTFAVVAMAFVFTTSCKGDDKTPPSGLFDGKITASVENGTDSDWSELIKRVHGVTENDQQVLATSNFTNGGFSLTLAAVNAQNLYGFGDLEGEGFKISNKDVKTSGIYIEGFSDENYQNWIGDFIRGKVDFTTTQNSSRIVIVMEDYIYADADVIITGTIKEDPYTEGGVTFKEEYKMFVHLKKGWNKLYMTEEIHGVLTTQTVTIKGTVSTESVSGLKWYYDEDFYDLLDDLYGKKAKQKMRKGAKNNPLFKK